MDSKICTQFHSNFKTNTIQFLTQLIENLIKYFNNTKHQFSSTNKQFENNPIFPMHTNTKKTAKPSTADSDANRPKKHPIDLPRHYYIFS